MADLKEARDGRLMGRPQIPDLLRRRRQTVHRPHFISRVSLQGQGRGAFIKEEMASQPGDEL